MPVGRIGPIKGPVLSTGYIYDTTMFKSLFSGFEQVPSFPWRSIFEYAGRLKGLLLRVPLVVSGSITVEVSLCACDFARRVRLLRRKSGALFTALYLKQCRVSLQRFVAGNFDPHEPLSVSVSLTRSGLPRLIPAAIRYKIARGDEMSHRYVKLYMSWLGLGRLILLAPKITKDTFDSIIRPTQDMDSVREVLGWIKNEYAGLHSRYFPWLSTIPLRKGISWVPTWKATPMNLRNLAYRPGVEPAVQLPDKGAWPPNIFHDLKYELAAFAWNVNVIHSFQDGVFSPGILWHERILYAHDRNNTLFANLDLESYEKGMGPFLASLIPAFESVWLHSGRLAQTFAGEGKRRIFAIPNYVKQRLMRPVHDWAASVLRRLPTDGMFDQTAPIHRLRAQGFNECYSFDLKSATDRWPLSLIYEIMAMMWSPTLASAIVNGTLGLNVFYVGKSFTSRPTAVTFNAGQPLGLYGSWTLFSLSHHYIVWMAANRAYPGVRSPFWNYAILGDDVVIADKRVASEYLILLDKIGVTISKGKSLQSTNGTLEFAKNFWSHQLKVDLSPVSMRALTMCRSIFGLASVGHKYGISSLKVYLRLAGAGYRVLGRMNSSRSKRWERIRVITSKPFRSGQLPLEWWLGRGLPLNPYLKGRIVVFLLKELKPKELRLFPDEMLFDGEREHVERKLLRCWVTQWLNWVLWYHTKLMQSEITVEELFDAPVCATSWKRQSFDLKRLKFGLLWKCYDMAAGWSLSTTPPCLGEVVIQFPGWILGGYKGTDFILCPEGLPSFGKNDRTRT